MVTRFSRRPAGIDVLLGLESRINKVDVLIFQVQADQRKELNDPLKQVKLSRRPYVPGLDKILEKHQEVLL